MNKDIQSFPEILLAWHLEQPWWPLPCWLTPLQPPFPLEHPRHGSCSLILTLHSLLISFMQLPSLEWAGLFSSEFNTHCSHRRMNIISTPSLFYGDSWHTWHCVTSLNVLSHWFLAIIQMDAIQSKKKMSFKKLGAYGLQDTDGNQQQDM